MFIFLYINITIKLDLPKNVKEKTDRKTYLKIGIKRIRTSVKSINSTSHSHFAIMPYDRAGVNRTRYLSFPKGVTHHFVFCPYYYLFMVLVLATPFLLLTVLGVTSI